MALHWSDDMGMWWVEERPAVTPAFKPMNFELIWSTAAPLDGEEVRIDGLDGELDREWQETGVQHAIVYQVAGDVDPDGDPTTSLGAGFAANHDALVEVFGRPSTWSGDSAATTVLRPDGVELAGWIKAEVEPLRPAGGATAMCVVQVSIARGCLLKVAEEP